VNTQLLGAFGSGGICLCIAVWVFLGSRKKDKQGKLAQKHDAEHTAWWMIIFGIFAAGAGQLGAAPAQIGTAFTNALNAQNTSIGSVGPGAAALLITLFLFGTKPRPWKDSILGMTVPSIYAAAGGLWALPITIAAGILKAVFA
jgi:hypothetical protein